MEFLTKKSLIPVYWKQKIEKIHIFIELELEQETIFEFYFT